MRIYAATILLSSILLFLIQPIIAKQVWPWFGGAAAVWTTCLVFFQLSLLAGYAYADLAQRLKPRLQAGIHIGLLAASFAMLPVIADPAWKPTGGEDPVWRIAGLLTATIGLPYFMLSTTGPLVQSWFAREGISPEAARRVYRFFALSNLGSILGLLAYPFAIERWASGRAQALGWTVGYLAFAVLCATCAWRARKHAPLPAEREPEPDFEPLSANVQRESAAASAKRKPLAWMSLAVLAGASLAALIPLLIVEASASRRIEQLAKYAAAILLAYGAVVYCARRTGSGEHIGTARWAGAPRFTDVLLWGVLSATPSVLLLAISTHITQNIASIPLLWVLPLTLYLLSFVLCFEGRGGRGWYARGYWIVPMLVAVGAMGLGMPGVGEHELLDLGPDVMLYAGGLFVVCMFCHGELAAARPAPLYLTRYYLVVSAGGAAGGLFVGLAAPRIFDAYWELPIGLLVCALLAAWLTRGLARRAANPSLRY